MVTIPGASHRNERVVMHNIHIDIRPSPLQSTTTHNLAACSGVPGTIHPLLAPHVKNEQPKRCQFRPYETSYWTLILQMWAREDASSVGGPLCILSHPTTSALQSCTNPHVQLLRSRLSILSGTLRAQTRGPLLIQHVENKGSAESCSASPR